MNGNCNRGCKSMRTIPKRGHKDTKMKILIISQGELAIINRIVFISQGELAIKRRATVEMRPEPNPQYLNRNTSRQLHAVQAKIKGHSIAQGRLEASEPQSMIYAYTKGDAEAGTSHVVTS
ncbi:hypothetical protein TIFTF001_043587 [Ficus carica]|uniref:Uncharacterized protein n=1 Tax=Ficus carica TaxID=3494 RepID=A0AA87YT45_FICCA|nr:hypothetical protein TIFTF001_043587 [Ficus carica]